MAGMSTVAEQLHLAREAKNLSVNQVAEVTKIRTDHIRALEEGNFNAFSAPVYIRGFVRTYATLLKLDVPRLMTTLDQELGATEKFREPPPLTDQPRNLIDFITLQLSKVNWIIASVIIGALVLLLIVAHRRPLVASPPGIQSPRRPSARGLSTTRNPATPSRCPPRRRIIELLRGLQRIHMDESARPC
jgi:cytoskeleton protein RodZ